MKLFLKFIVLTITMTVLWIVSLAVGMAIFGVDSIATQESSSVALPLLYLVSTINTLIIYLFIQKSIWRGWKLVFVITTILFSIQFFLSQIEALYFIESLQMPIDLIYAIILAGLILSFSFAFIAVTLLGRWKGGNTIEETKILLNHKLIMQTVLLAAVVYPVLYFTAGYFIAWQFSELRLLYSGSEAILPFIDHFRELFKTDPWLYPFQIVRGLLWIGIAVLIMKSTRAERKYKALLTGLIFAIIMNSQHLIPNPYMPGWIPLYHFIETASSNFIWGFFVVKTLARNNAS